MPSVASTARSCGSAMGPTFDKSSALPQDLAVLATLGIPHAERNGHHYFAGLSQFSPAIQSAAQIAHADLYEPHPDGFPMARIRAGRMEIGSVIDAPFGVAFEPDLRGFTPLGEWSPESLDAEP